MLPVEEHDWIVAVIESLKNRPLHELGEDVDWLPCGCVFLMPCDDSWTELLRISNQDDRFDTIHVVHDGQAST